ncbi:MAG: hypothetical protein FWC97_00230 [Treponema sp.]|nr:hypothetical protein [Treponema sp.]
MSEKIRRRILDIVRKGTAVYYNHGRRLAKSRVGSGWSWLSSTDALASQRCHSRHISPTRLFASRLPTVIPPFVYKLWRGVFAIMIVKGEY